MNSWIWDWVMEHSISSYLVEEVLFEPIIFLFNLIWSISCYYENNHLICIEKQNYEELMLLAQEKSVEHTNVTTEKNNDNINDSVIV